MEGQSWATKGLEPLLFQWIRVCHPALSLWIPLCLSFPILLLSSGLVLCSPTVLPALGSLSCLPAASPSQGSTHRVHCLFHKCLMSCSSTPIPLPF